MQTCPLPYRLRRRSSNPRPLTDAIMHLRAASAAISRLERSQWPGMDHLYETKWMLDSYVLGALESVAVAGSKD